MLRQFRNWLFDNLGLPSSSGHLVSMARFQQTEELRVKLNAKKAKIARRRCVHFV